MTSTPPASHAPVPTTPAALTRRLVRTVTAATLLTAAVLAGVVQLSGRPEWWPAFGAATVVSVAAGFLSVVVLSMAAGKTVDWLVTYVMGGAAARMFVSLFGLLICVMGLKTPAEPTGYMICCYFVVLLVAESTVLNRATQANAVGGPNA
ncbi:MAG TPA: hypothetical protein VF595_03980 [Tepidisphaeraceae bacterium]|jgi:hypothetical protein